MSEKPGWFGGLMGRTARPLPTSAKRCANGHPMGIDWKECPYCKALQGAAKRTRMTGTDFGSQANADEAQTRPAGSRPGPTVLNEDRAAAPPPRPADRGPGAGSRRQTRVDEEPGASPSSASSAGPSMPGRGPSSRRQTSVIDPDDQAASTQVPVGSAKRLTGILVTFTWSKLGRLFEIRAGRNYVGSGVVSTEGDRPVDVLLSEDRNLSGTHFLILCQNNGEKYRIRDCDSTNGTLVNGNPIDNLGIDLDDGSLIMAGSTVFTFQKVRPPSLEIETEQASEAEEAEAPPPDRLRHSNEREVD